MRGELEKLRSEKEQLLEAYWRLNALESTGATAKDLISASSSAQHSLASEASPPSNLADILASTAPQQRTQNTENIVGASATALPSPTQSPQDSVLPGQSRTGGQQGWDSVSWISSEDSRRGSERDSEDSERDSEDDSPLVARLDDEVAGTAHNPLFGGDSEGSSVASNRDSEGESRTVAEEAFTHVPESAANLQSGVAGSVADDSSLPAVMLQLPAAALGAETGGNLLMGALAGMTSLPLPARETLKASVANPVFQQALTDIDSEAGSWPTTQAQGDTMPNEVEAQGAVDLLRGYREPLSPWPSAQRALTADQTEADPDSLSPQATRMHEAVSSMRSQSQRLDLSGLSVVKEEQETWLMRPPGKQAQAKPTEGQLRESEHEEGEWGLSGLFASHGSSPSHLGDSAHLERQLSQMTDSLAQSRQQALLEREYSTSLERQLSEAQAALARQTDMRLSERASAQTPRPWSQDAQATLTRQAGTQSHRFAEQISQQGSQSGQAALATDADVESTQQPAEQISQHGSYSSPQQVADKHVAEAEGEGETPPGAATRQGGLPLSSKVSLNILAAQEAQTVSQDTAAELDKESSSPSRRGGAALGIRSAAEGSLAQHGWAVSGSEAAAKEEDTGIEAKRSRAATGEHVVAGEEDSGSLAQHSRAVAATEDMGAPMDEGFVHSASLREPFELRIIRLEAENLELLGALDNAETREEEAKAEAQKLAGKLEEAQGEAWDAMVAEEDMSNKLEAAQSELYRRYNQVEALVARLAVSRGQQEASTAEIDSLTLELKSAKGSTAQASAEQLLTDECSIQDTAMPKTSAAEAPGMEAAAEKAGMASVQKRVDSLSAALAEAHAKNAAQEKQLWKFVAQLEDARQDMQALMDRLMASAQQAVQHSEATHKLKARLYQANCHTAGQEAQIWQLVDELMAVREKLQVQEPLTISPRLPAEPKHADRPLPGGPSALPAHGQLTTSPGMPDEPKEAQQAAAAEGNGVEGHRAAPEAAASPAMLMSGRVSIGLSESAGGPKTVKPYRFPADSLLPAELGQQRDFAESQRLVEGDASTTGNAQPIIPDSTSLAQEHTAEIPARVSFGSSKPPASGSNDAPHATPTVKYSTADRLQTACQPVIDSGEAPQAGPPIGRASTDYPPAWSAKIVAEYEREEQALKSARLDGLAQGEEGVIPAVWGAAGGNPLAPINSLSEVAEMAAQADQGALVKQLSDHVLHLESSLSVANAQVAVNVLERQSLQKSIETALRELAVSKLAEEEAAPDQEQKGPGVEILQFGRAASWHASPTRGMTRLQALQEAVASLEAETARWRDITQSASGDTEALLASIRTKAADLDALASAQGTPPGAAAPYPAFTAQSVGAKRLARTRATQAFVAKIKADLQEVQVMLEEALRQAEDGLGRPHSRLGTPRSPSHGRAASGNDADMTAKVATLRRRFKKLEKELAEAQAAADDFKDATWVEAGVDAAHSAVQATLEDELFFMPLTVGARGASFDHTALTVGVY